MKNAFLNIKNRFFINSFLKNVFFFALLHRDYGVYSVNRPVCVEMYNDRLTISNSGGLYGRVSIDTLGSVHPESRNPTLAKILEIMRIAENRFSGIPTIRHEFKAAGLPEPEFESRRGEFVVTFRNGSGDNLKEDSAVKRINRKNMTNEEVLAFCAVPRSREEIQEFTGFARSYAFAKFVRPLLKKGKLRLTIPDKPKCREQKFVRATDVSR